MLFTTSQHNQQKQIPWGIDTCFKSDFFFPYSPGILRNYDPWFFRLRGKLFLLFGI